MGVLARHKKCLAEADIFYKKIGKIVCPYFGHEIPFNSDGFHHLQFSADRERDKKEQMLKFSLLPSAPMILKNSGTVQEHRKTMEAEEAGRYSKRGRKMVEVEYWGFVAIVGKKDPLRIKVIVRRVGTGQIHFWSIMPAQRMGEDAYLKVGSDDMQDG